MHEVNPKDLFRLRSNALEEWSSDIFKEYRYQKKLQQYIAIGEMDQRFQLGVSITLGSLARLHETRSIINQGVKAGKTFMQMLEKISPELARVYAPTIRILTIANSSTADTDIKDEDIGSNFSRPIWASQVLGRMRIKAQTIDGGRFDGSKGPPPSAGTAVQLFGAHAPSAAMTRHPTLLNLLKEYLETTYYTPAGSPRGANTPDSTLPTFSRTLAKPNSLDPLSCQPLTRQGSAPIVTHTIFRQPTKPIPTSKALTPNTHSRKLSKGELPPQKKPKLTIWDSLSTLSCERLTRHESDPIAPPPIFRPLAFTNAVPSEKALIPSILLTLSDSNDQLATCGKQKLAPSLLIKGNSLTQPTSNSSFAFKSWGPYIIPSSLTPDSLPVLIRHSSK